MRQERYQKIAENFAEYANRKVEYERFWPSINKYIKSTGFLVGIGVGCNQGMFIIASCGTREAIEFERVKKVFLK